MDADRCVILRIPAEIACFVPFHFDSLHLRDAHYARYGAIPPPSSEGNRFIRDPDL
jgi:hypothetical protein